MTFTTVIYHCENGSARITLNRPDRMNSFTQVMHEELRAALALVQSDGARVLVITGAGRGFCAGQDLNDRAVAPGQAVDLGDSVEKNYAPLVKAIRALPIPVIAAVNGVAAGAGCNFALACDLVAMGLALLGDKISAKRAADIGLIFECVADVEFAPRIDSVAAQLASGPTLGYARTKQAIYASPDNSLDSQLALEGSLMRECGFSEDYREGVAAFKEKRAAVFTGR